MKEAAERDLSELDAVLAHYTDRLRLGDAPTIDDCVRRHPHLAADLRDLLPVVVEAERLKSVRQASRSRRAGETPSLVHAGDTADGAPHADTLAYLDALFAPAQGPDELGRIGPYRVLSLLGRGGMGAVFVAEDLRLGRRVALKVMLPSVARQPKAAERFLREVRTAAALEHDHVVAVLHVDEDRGFPYLAMPLLRGVTLEERLAQGPPLAVAEIARIGRQIAEGLAAAHAKGMVHRDVKPANVFLEETDAGPRVKLLDFGLARPVDLPAEATGDVPPVRDAAASVTQVGAVVGTPSYMAPEQTQCVAIDGRADLFSLGVILYRMATGKLPFAGPSAAATLRSLVSDTPPAPQVANPSVPPALSRLIVDLLAKARERRPASAGDVAQRLRAIESAPACPRRRIAVLAAVAVALGLVIALAVTVLRVESPDGVLTLRVHDDSLVVSVRDGTATVAEKSSARTFQVKAKQGEIEVYDRDGAQLLVTKRFEMRSGAKTVLEVSADEVAAARDRPDLAWRSAFDGKTLAGWKTHPDLPGNWSVEAGALVSRGRRSWLFLDRPDVGDFRLRGEAKLAPGADSGLFFWTPFAMKRFSDGQLNPPHWHEANLSRRPGFAGLGALDGQGLRVDVASTAVPDGWFAFELSAEGKSVVCKIDGRPVSSLTFPEAQRGHLALQSSGGPAPVWFRNLALAVPKAE